MISISALNMHNNVNFGFSHDALHLVFAWSRQMSTIKKTGQRKTSRRLLTSTGHWT